MSRWETAKAWKDGGSSVSLGLEIFIAVIAGYWLGQKGDEHFHTAPTLLIVGVLLGVGTAILSVVKAVRHMRIATLREEAEQGNPEPMYPVDDKRSSDVGPRSEHPPS